MTPSFRKRLRAFGRADDGVVAVEFALLFPFIFFLFIWAVELGILMTKSVMLESSLDVAMRDLRLGNIVLPPTQAAQSDVLKDIICSRARIISDCRGTIMLELTPIDAATWTMPAREVTCIDRSADIQPPLEFNIGQQNQVMLIRACVIIEPLFPGTGIGAMLPKDPQGGYSMVALSAFVNEPT